MDSMLSDTGALLPELSLFLGGLVCLLGGSFTPRTRQWRLRIVAALASTVAVGLGVAGLSSGPRRIFDASFVVDDGTNLARIAVGVALLLVLLIAGSEIAGHPRESETYSLLLFSATGSTVMAGTTDLALLIGAFLLSSIPLYGLVAIVRRPGSAEAALKTYLLGAIFGIFLMMGVVLLYAVAGETGYAALGAGLESGPAAAVAAGVVAVLAGLLFKAGGVPAHFWVPDASQGSSVTAAAFLTTVPKIGALIAIARLVDHLPDARTWAVALGVLAAASMTLGNLAAYFQDDVRRLLGWSTVSQVGYLLAPVAVIGLADLAGPSLLLYLAAYAVTNVGAFAVVAATGRSTIADYRGLASSEPRLALSLVVVLLGLVGTPPTAVFVGKLTTTSAVFDGGLAWLAAVILLNTVISLFYYLRWIAPMFSRVEPSATGPVETLPMIWAGARTAAYSAALVSIALGVGAGVILAAVSPWSPS
ncbi:NADH-quinone oxidoreductase subunit N [Nocardioides salsibiostraticola]